MACCNVSIVLRVSQIHWVSPQIAELVCRSAQIWPSGLFWSELPSTFFWCSPFIVYAANSWVLRRMWEQGCGWHTSVSQPQTWHRGNFVLFNSKFSKQNKLRCWRWGNKMKEIKQHLHLIYLFILSSLSRSSPSGRGLGRAPHSR